jgi:threonine/homoserine/homoserine lactone efflux protein
MMHFLISSVSVLGCIYMVYVGVQLMRELYDAAYGGDDLPAPLATFYTRG